MDRFDHLDDDDLSWGEVASVVGMIAVCIIGAGYVALRLVGLL